MSNFQYLIHEYLEGTLSEELQTFLFQEMSANDELRHELLTQIHIQQQAKDDFTTITAPDDVKDSLFVALGLSEPVHNSQIIAAATNHAGDTSFLAAGIAIVSTLCLGTFIGWYGHSLQFSEQQTHNGMPKNSSPAIALVENSSTQIIAEKKHLHSTVSHSSVMSQHLIPALSKPVLSDNQQQHEDFNIAMSEIPSILAVESLNPNNSYTEDKSNRRFLLQSPPSIEQLYFEDNAIITRFSTLYPLIGNSSSGQIFQVFYALEDNNSIGLEYSTGTVTKPSNELYDGEIRTTQESQQFSAYSVAASHRMNYLEVLDIIPISTMSLGSTITGEPIARFSTGFSWTPENRVSLGIGADVSTIAYSQSGTWKSTSSVSIMGSLSIRF